MEKMTCMSIKPTVGIGFEKGGSIHANENSKDFPKFYLIVYNACAYWIRRRKE